jgi:hypothetical protein
MPHDWEFPDWDKVNRVHNWHNYVSEEVQTLWPTFNNQQKQALAAGFEDVSLNEEWD